MERKADGDRSDPKMEGYLEKKGKSRLVSLWHRYWFVLEGAQLSYYDSRPSSAETPSKGAITLTSMTSITAYSPSQRQPESHSQQSNCEIYILTQTKLITLRTKDVNDHKTWMCALLGQIASLGKGWNKGHINAHPPHSSLGVPYQSSHINYRHSLTNLTTMEENNGKHLSKGSRTMEYRDSKSGSTGNILDRQVLSPNRVMDSETSSEEDVGVDKGQEEAIKNRNEDSKYKCDMEEVSVSTKMTNEELISEERVENVPEKLIVTNVTDQRRTHLEQQVSKTVQSESKAEEKEYSRLKEVQSVQTQESKVKSRKFFGKRETKANSVQMSGVKVYKKSRDTVVTDRLDADPKLPRGSKGDKRSKVEEIHSKDESILKKRMTDFRSDSSSSDYKVPVSHSQQGGESSIPEKSEGIKSPKKSKIKRVKSKKESKGCQYTTEGQSYRKSKMAKAGELQDDGETKTKVKKMGFFSKFVKCKKNENSDEKSEEMEIDPSPGLSKDPKTPEEEQSFAREASPEKKVPHLPRHKAMGMGMVPKDDEEFRKKLLTRKLKIEADQDSPVGTKETENINVATAMPMHHNHDVDDDKPVTIVNNGGENATPSLPPRAQTHAPPIPERKINPSQPGNKRNLPLENLPPIATKPKLSPRLPEKHRNSGIEMKSNYDIVKFKVKKKENVEKPALIVSQGMSPYSFTSKSSATMNVSEAHTEHNNVNGTQRRMEVEVRGSETEKTDMNLEEEFRMTMQMITSKEISSDTSSIQSANTIEGEVMDCMNMDIDFGKRNSADIQATTFVETYSLKSTSEHSVGELWSASTSTPIPRVTVSVTPSSPPIPTEADLDTVPSTSFSNTYYSSSLGTDEKAFNKVDELGLLLSELDRINATPLVGIDSEKPVLSPKEAKRLSSDKEDLLEAFPIRKRRNSDPDYDIPRPHRLPKHLQESQDPDKIDISKDDNDRKDRDTTNSLIIEATCFLGPGMDQSFNENRYYGFSANDWNRKSDEMKQYLECKYGDISEDKDVFLQNLKLNPADLERKEIEDDFSASKLSEKQFEEEGESSQGSRRDSEISVNLRPERIDRSCRNERSREVHESDFDSLLNLTAPMESLSITGDLDEGHTVGTSNQERDALLQVDNPSDPLEATEESNLEDCESRKETPGAQFEAVDSIAHANKMAVTSSTVADDERLLHISPVEMDAEESAVVLRNPVRSDLRDSKTLRLSFATTETLIVEEEVLVASLKTTTTTTFTSPAEDQTNNAEIEKVEESVEEVVLDMDSIPDDHFGSMKIQSCVQT